MAITPITNKGAPNQVRYLGDIYTGQQGTGRYVPNVNDILYDFNSGLFRVIVVDESTNLSEWVPWIIPGSPTGVRPEDVLLGIGPGYQSETFRILIDTSVRPRRMQFDGRLHTYSPLASHCKVFLGTNIEVNPIVISQHYNENMNPLGENVPLVLAEESDVQNYTKKVPVETWCNRDVPNGQPLTVVMYGVGGNRLSIQTLLARETRFIRGSEDASRMITGISLDSPFISETEENTINLPLDTPIDSLGLRGIVYFNDGPRIVGLDGAKFALEGLRNFSASYAGQRHPLVLRYNLGPGESAESAELLPNGQAHVSDSWWARIVESPGGTNVKLFILPEWDADANRWRLQYFLYSLDRNAYYYVSPEWIELGTNSPSFEPVNYIIVQHLTVAVDLRKIDPSLPNHRHVQSFDIALRGNGVNLGTDTRWNVYYTPYDNLSAYGENLFIELRRIAIGNWEVRIDCQLPNMTEWLEQVFYKTQPLWDTRTESRAPAPTHFILSINGINNEYPINQWNTVLTSITGGQQSGVAALHFIARVGGTDLHLGVSPLRIVQIL